uniref:Uncharacterized protein n=1 Tax=Trichobilharzia regenti TaxID=157069 RepID=A0AA85JIC4_TRIRE|nr:unnamed protein product [Trichobilharzia regenti]
MSFRNGEVMAMGLNFTFLLFPGLGTGTILMSFHGTGTTFSEKEAFMILVREHKASAHCFRTYAGMPSGPRLCEGLRVLRHFKTSRVLKSWKLSAARLVTLEVVITEGECIKDLLRALTSQEEKTLHRLLLPVISLKNFHMLIGDLHDKSVWL